MAEDLLMTGHDSQRSLSFLQLQVRCITKPFLKDKPGWRLPSKKSWGKRLKKAHSTGCFKWVTLMKATGVAS